MEEKEVILQRVWKNEKANQKLVTIPKDSDIKEDDFVFIQKAEFNKREIYKTDIERIMFNALTKENIDFCFQFPIRGKYGYILDFAIPEIKLAIECDGEQWHLPNNDRDRKRDFVLKSRGWTILRFKGEEIRADVNKCISEIKLNIMKGGQIQHGES